MKHLNGKLAICEKLIVLKIIFFILKWSYRQIQSQSVTKIQRQNQRQYQFKRN